MHVSHGIAYFKGIVTRENDGDMRDYLQLEYAEGDQLFVPVERLDRVTRYVGCLLYTSPSPRDRTRSRMPSSA